ncbi:MAG: sugar phosphate isomerase/epimerase family protein [Terriglobia bacterium]
MKTNLLRRQFLQTAGALAGATLGLRASAQQMPAGATSDKLPRLLPGCCAYSYGRYLNLKHPTMTLEDFIRQSPKLKLIAVDMTTYYLKSADPAYLASLRHLAYKHAVAFSGAACGVSMVQAVPEARQQSLAQIRQWVDVTNRLGAPHLRVFAGKLPAGHTVTEAIGWVAETMKAACDYAGERGIMIGVEDHQGVTQRADVCLEIMHRVNSPWAGINLDITHFVPTPTEDAYAQIKACIPYATNTHIRDEFDDQTPIDMDRVWNMFAQAGFQGYMSVEYEKKLYHGEDAKTGVPKLVAEVRRLCKKYSSV